MSSVPRPPDASRQRSMAWLPIAILASAQVGLLALAGASLLLLATVNVELDETEFALALALFGVGAGLLLSQLGNVIMSSVRPEQTNEAGGLQGTAQNLGASLGTALIGAVLIAGLTNGFVQRIEENPAIPEPVRERVAELAEEGIPIVPVAEVDQAAVDAGLPADQARALAQDYGEAQLQGLKRAIGAVAILALLSLWFTRGLPGRAPPAPAPATGGHHRGRGADVTAAHTAE